MELNITVYLITNILRVYASYKLIKSNYNEIITNRKIETLSYILFYIVISFVYVKYSTPILTLITYTCGLFILTLNYSRNIKQNILVVIFVYFIGFLTDVLTVIILNSKNIYIFKTNIILDIYIYVFSSIIKYIISIVLYENKVNVKEGRKLSFSLWIYTISIPIMTLFLIVVMFSIIDVKDKLSIALIISMVMLINIASYKLYENIVLILKQENRKFILEQQNKYYINQLSMIQDDNKTMAKFRHDIKNHLISLKILYDNNEIDNFKNYCENLLGKIDNSSYSKSGNNIIDSLLNYKLKNLSDNVNKHISISVPTNLDIQDTDLTSLLGNLLDNTLKAINETTENKLLDLSIHYKKGRLIIKIKNSYSAIHQAKNGDLITTKTNRKNHGIGMSNIKDIVEKYNGILKINTKNNIFDVVVIMYC